MFAPHMSDAIALRNRFAMVKGAWDDHLPGIPFPALGGAPPSRRSSGGAGAGRRDARRATPETAEQAADAMWGLVPARPDSDAVKQRVTQHHEDLARLGHRLR